MILLAAGYGEQAPTDYRWASGYLALAVDYAIVSPDDITELDYPVNRSLVAQMACRALGLSPTGSSPFADIDDPYATALYENGVLEGTIAGNHRVFRPYDRLTRAELSAIIWRLCNL